MITDFERNVRTLIVCFVIALVVLVPLRFVEINNQGQRLKIDSRVLGEVCFSKEEISRTIEEINQRVIEKDLNSGEISELAKVVDSMKNNECF